MRVLYSLLFCSICSCFFGQNMIDANIPDKIEAYSTHTIEITIKKGPISSFSKYQLDVPANVSIKEGISLDGNFSFENQRAKLVWVDSPKQDEFTVTMIMAVGNASGQGTFEHRYYYIDGETKKEISDGPMYVDFVPGVPSENNNKELTETPVTPSVTPTKTPSVAAVSSTVPPAVSKPTVEPVKNDGPQKTNITIPVSTPNTNTTVPTTSVSTSQPNSSNTTPVSLPEIKEYKVQIASMSSKPNLSKYSNLGMITVIEENGLYKVLAGSYKTKEEAVKKMEELKAKGHAGFVVCLVNGVKVK